MRLGAAALAVAALLLTARACWTEPRTFVLREAAVPLAGWPAPLDGLVVAALADVHTGSPHTPVAKLRLAVDAINARRPDLVVLLGDYVIQGVLGGRFVSPEVTAAELGRLKAPLGVVAVLGNHDWWLDGKRVRAAFERSGITVLENEALERRLRGQPVWIAGLADLWTRRPDLEKTLVSVPPGAALLLLTHSPDVFPRVPASVSLTLAGHTHGGQVSIPFLGPPLVPSRYGQRYASGLVVEEGRPLFVTTGLGTSIVPVRFRVPPEAAILTLRSLSR